MGPGFHGLKTMIQLDLSDSQKLKVMSILEKYENERASLKQSLREERHSLIKLLKAEQFNEDEIRSALRRAAPIREELLVMRVKMMAELKTVLTPAQLQLLEQRKGHRIGRRKARGGPWPEDTTN
jgi:Spy/CpxP family protein refolding chaperone